MLFYYILLCGLLLIVNSVVKRCLKKINSEITLKYFRLLPLLNMEFPEKCLAGAGVLTAGAGTKITGVCTALQKSDPLASAATFFVLPTL